VEGFARGLEHVDDAFRNFCSGSRMMISWSCVQTTATTPLRPAPIIAGEYVPVLAMCPRAARAGRSGRPIGVRSTFADLGATIAEFLGIPWSLAGESFLRHVL